MTRLIARIRNTIPWIRYYYLVNRTYQGIPPKGSWTAQHIKETGRVLPATFDWEPLSKQLQNWSIG